MKEIKTLLETSGRFTLIFSTQDHDSWKSLLRYLANEYNSKIQQNGSNKYPNGVSAERLVLAGGGCAGSLQDEFQI